MQGDFQPKAEGHTAIISREADWQLFDRAVEILVKEFGGAVVEKLDAPDQRYWDIKVGEAIFTLHLEHYLGISLYSKDKQAGEIIKTIAGRIAK